MNMMIISLELIFCVSLFVFSNTEKVEIYYPKSCNRFETSHSPGKDSLLVKVSTHFTTEC